MSVITAFLAVIIDKVLVAQETVSRGKDEKLKPTTINLFIIGLSLARTHNGYSPH